MNSRKPYSTRDVRSWSAGAECFKGSVGRAVVIVKSGQLRDYAAFMFSKIKATRANGSECNVIWLHRKRIIMHCSGPFGDGNNKLVILQERQHDVPQWSTKI
jgi:hypothetical protein